MPSSPARSSQKPNGNAEFDREAEVVLHELQPALAAVLEGLRPPVKRAMQLQRLLNVSQKLSWSMFSAATAKDPRSLASLLPKRRGIERFFLAASLHGVPDETIDRARAAFERFEESVARLAGGRDAFETMVAGVRAEDGGSVGADLKHKRAAFRTNSLLWGRQGRVFCATKIMCPGASPGLLDAVFIKGMLGLHRTSRAVALHTTARQWRSVYPGDPAETNPPEALDPRERGGGEPASPEGLALLRDFCSVPLPQFRLRDIRPDYRSYELVSDSLGPTGEVTYFTGEALRAASAVPGSILGSEVMLSKIVDLPIEAYVGDILMHKSVWGTRVPDVRVYAVSPDGSMDFQETDLMPLTESAEYLGEGLYAARNTLIPRYEEMLSYAMERMGWNPEEFRVFRCHVEYPVLHTRIRMTLG